MMGVPTSPRKLGAAARSTVALVALLLAAVPSASAAPPTSYSLAGSRVFPEGVTVVPGTRTFYVSSTNGGAIYRGMLDRARTRVFLPGGRDGRTAAVGMKADRAGRLYVAGGATGRLYVYSTRTRRLIRTFDTGLRAPDTFVNDVSLAPNGDAYFTDSRRPVVYRVSAAAAASPTAAVEAPEVYLDLAGSPVSFTAGNNLNGIAVAGAGSYLIAVQSSTGQLFRVETASKRVTEIDLGGARLTRGDGLLLIGRTLYVVRNMDERIVKIAMAPDFSSGRIRSSTTNRALRFPTTIAAASGDLLAVNAQFDRRESGRPHLPFDVVRVRRP